MAKCGSWSEGSSNTVIGDGSTIRFWKDKWLFNRTLLEVIERDLPMDLRDMCVRDLWIKGIGWDLSRIEPFVSGFVRLSLAAIVVDNITWAKDKLSWGENHEGKFTVTSAYSYLTRDSVPKPNMEILYGKIWRVKAPERVRVFLWLVVNQLIMTNSERQRRHLCDSGLCQICKMGEETIQHVLRDCLAILGIWTRIVLLRKRSLFFEQTLFEWVYANLSNVEVINEVPWATLFSVAAWWGWKWRCGNVFDTNGKCRDRVRIVKDMAHEVGKATIRTSGCGLESQRVERLIAWKPPRDGWVKLNTDGASRGNPGLASAGGVFRDGEGQWIQGFALNIGSYGLYIALELKVIRLELEVDSKLVVGFLTTRISDTHPLSFLVRLCYGFLTRDWIVRVSHVYREANRLADGLANYAFSRPLGIHLLELCPSCPFLVYSEDNTGAAYPRRIRL